MSKEEKAADKSKKMSKKVYEAELQKLQTELVKMQYWVKEKGLRVVILFEGRDAAGKGGCIKRITEALNPRGARVVALGVPSDREKTQWYFQRYASHLRAAGESILFDRSWYNRTGVEKVMKFCTGKQYREFLRSCPEFERMLVRSGIIVLALRPADGTKSTTYNPGPEVRLNQGDAMIVLGRDEQIQRLSAYAQGKGEL